MTAVEGWQVVSRIGGDRIAVPVVAWWPAPQSPLLGPFTIVSILAGVMLAIGWRPAPAATTCAITEAGFLMWDQQTYSSHRMLVMLLCSYLAFAASDSTWAIRSTGRASPPEPRLLMMVQLSVVYLFAALSKVNNAFLSGAVLRLAIWWPVPDWLFAPLAYATVATELFLALGLWFRRTRSTAVCAGLGLHISIVAMLHDPLPLIAFALACVPLYPLYFLPGPRLGSLAGQSPSGRTDNHRRSTSARPDEGAMRWSP